MSLLLLMSTLLCAVTVDKEDDEFPSPEAVTDGTLVVENETNESSEPKPAVVVTAVSRPFRRRHPVGKHFVILLGISLMTALTVGVISLYKHLASASKVGAYKYNPPRCGGEVYGEDISQNLVMLNTVGYPSTVTHSTINEEFEQQVEINEEFEKILVPVIRNSQKATILHDFNMNMTAIIDKDKGCCYIMNLNRSLVLPPRDFRDILIKLKFSDFLTTPASFPLSLKMRYYIPDSEVLHVNYSAVTPPIQDLTPFGIYIKEECSKLDTYRLVKMDEPDALSKHSICDIQSEKYCLGEAGKKKMMCFNIVSCL